MRGKVVKDWCDEHGIEDHPRLCGEKFGGGQDLYPAAGSPPPMRGKECKVEAMSKEQRITPAYAGKRRLSTFLFPATGDHPRLCGEKFVRCSRSFTLSGSPPPMRGKVSPLRSFPRPAGITPAYAGKRTLVKIKREK